MNWRNTLIMLVVAAAAGIFLWKVGPNLTSSEERKQMEDRVFKGFKNDRSKIDRVEIVRPEDTVELVKKSEEHWELTKPISYRADHWTAGDLVGKFTYTGDPAGHGGDQHGSAQGFATPARVDFGHPGSAGA